MDSIDLAKFDQLKATGDLPSPKGAALAIIRLTQREDTALADLAHAVKADPAFVGRLIKAANSVQSGGRRPIVSVQDALMVLGIPAVRSMALGFSLLSNYKGGNCPDFDYPLFWSRSLVFALALQAQAKITRAIPVDDAFSVGLLAHIGELALATIFPDDYASLLRQYRQDGSRSLLELERQSVTMTHNELTAAMMQDWGVPKLFAEPVFHHETPEAAEFAEGSRQQVLLWSLVLSDHLADVCLAPDALRHAMMPQLLLLGSKLSIKEAALNAMSDQVAREWREWGALLGVATLELPPFAELAKRSNAVIPSATEVHAAAMNDLCMRILVVDDDPGMRAILKAMLAGAGHTVFEAADGEQAFEMALDTQPHILVLDWLMPGMDGIELTRSLRQTRIGRSAYILILTGQEEDDRLVEAFEAGVDDYMVKPLKPRLLAARLRAGQRVIKLQQEIEREREEIRRFAAELAVANRRLQEAALTDALTGFPNRRYAIDRIQQEWAAADRSKRPMACMVVDVDQFKSINDTHGHDVGDIVLCQTAVALKSGLRAQDVISRMGGDEFLVLCPDTDLPAALVCAERMRRAVDGMRMTAGTLKLQGSVSIGIAVRDDTMDDADALIKCADRGVYLAKQRGRNRLAAIQHGQ